MALEEYRRKRNFRITSEPSDKAKGRSGGKPIFVVQEHHATRLHYDFRLEAEGVLKSWAVTKIPTLDPKIRRLAIEVEDHPLAYAEFEGDIPEGQYGAGHVEIWDRGTYEFIPPDGGSSRDVVEAIEDGKLEVELSGRRLKGRFNLIRTGERSGRNQWLLMKRNDEHAVAMAGQESDATQKSGSTRSRRTAATESRSDATERSGSARGRRTAATNSSSDATESESDAPAKTGGRARARRSGAASADDGPRSMPRSARATKEGRAPKEVRTTNVDKIMFPEVGITKADVLEYYERIAPLMLPHLVDRPITLERLPDGIGDEKPRFWQKNTPAHYPSWIPRVELPSDDGKLVNYALVNDAQTLRYLVNQGAITFHVWMSRVADLDRPDFVLFDLDPGEREFADVIVVARTLHEILVDRKIEAAVKTSGKSGLHVMAPWPRQGNDDVAREWAMEIAREVVAALPDVATVERSKAKRDGRLYLDVMQNVRGHHMVAPYTLRPTPSATISMPLDWTEVRKGLSPEKFNLKSVFRRLARKTSDPLAALAPRRSRSRSRSRS